MTQMGLAVDFAAYHAESAAIALGLAGVAAVACRARPTRSLSLVVLGSVAWAAWVLGRAPVVVWLGPLLAVTAAFLWSAPPQHGDVQRWPDGVRNGRKRMRHYGLAERLDVGVMWACGAVALAGVWLAVPDTEVPIVVMAAAAPVAAWAWWAGTPGEGPVRAGFVGLVALAAVGGTGGRSAWVGGLACAGLLWLPIIQRRWWVTITVQTVMVIAASRLVSRWEIRTAAVASVGLVLAGWALLRFTSNDQSERASGETGSVPL